MLRAIKVALLAVMTVFGLGFSLTTISPTQVYPIGPVDHPWVGAFCRGVILVTGKRRRAALELVPRNEA